MGLDGLAGLFQEAAWQHAQILGVAFTEENRDLFWALHRLGVRVHRRPRWGETITVTTWPSRIERLFAMREYAIYGDSLSGTDRPDRDGSSPGELLVEASSSWLVLRVVDSRPVPPARVFPQGDLQEEYAVELPLGKLPAISPENALDRLSRGAQWHRVRPSDADRNEHVNNARYAQWFADEAPLLLENLMNGSGASREAGAPDPATLLLSFTAETRVGEEFAVITDKDNATAEIHVRTPGQTLESARCACRLQKFEAP